MRFHVRKVNVYFNDDNHRGFFAQICEYNDRIIIKFASFHYGYTWNINNENRLLWRLR